MPPRRVAVADRVRPRPPDGALPRQTQRVQRLPGQGGLHHLLKWTGNRPRPRPLATLRSRPIPPRTRAHADQSRHADPRHRGDTPPHSDHTRRSRRATGPHRCAGLALPRPPTAHPGRLPRPHSLHRAASHHQPPHATPTRGGRFGLPKSMGLRRNPHPPTTNHRRNASRDRAGSPPPPSPTRWSNTRPGRR
jgi:hypothetical protein